MSKFKVGDKVKGTKQSSEAYMITNEDMLLGEITHIYEDINGIDIKVLKHKDKKYEGEEIYCIHFKDSYFELAQPKQFTKADLKERYIVVTRNGNEYVVHDKRVAYGITEGKLNSKYLDFKNYNNDLTDKNKKEWDIVEIYKPHYSKVWKCEEEPARKMTVAEICKELGYDIEIVKDGE